MAGSNDRVGTAAGGPVLQVDVDSAHADVALRCAELLRQMPTTPEQDAGLLAGAGAGRSGAKGRGGEEGVTVGGGEAGAYTRPLFQLSLSTFVGYAGWRESVTLSVTKTVEVELKRGRV